MSNLRTGDDHRFAVGDAIARARLLEKMVADKPQAAEAQPIPASRFLSGGLVAAFVVGTGGLLTADYVAARNDRGYRLQEFEFRGGEFKAISRQLVRSSTENLARVRHVLRPTTIELAVLVGVSRQTIYNWQSGQIVAPHNEARLEELAKASDLLVASGISGALRPLTRKLPGGKTIFEAIREGSTPEDAVKKLISMFEREVRQRNSISQRLAGRVRKPIDISEIGSPYPDESA